MRVASIVVPAVNRFGGSRTTVADAVGADRAGRRPGAVRRAACAARGGTHGCSGPPAPFRRKGRIGKTGLYGLTRIDRLGLEMALHEDAERRAMQGELALLEAAWRDAEEIAGISDNLLLPDNVQSFAGEDADH